MYQANGNNKKVILTSDKGEFSPKNIKGEKECHLILIIVTIHKLPKNMCIHTPNITATTHIE